MRFLVSWCMLQLLASTVFAETESAKAASANAVNIAHWTSYPRLLSLDDELEPNAQRVQDAAYYAAGEESLELALEIQKTLVSDLEKQDFAQGKSNVSWIADNARLSLSEFEAVSRMSSTEQKQYRELLAEYLHILDIDEPREEQRETLAKSLEALRKLVPGKNWNLHVVVEQSLGTYYLALSEPAKASDCFRNVAQLRKEQFGTLNKHYLFAEIYLGYALLDLKEFQQAESHFREVLSALRSLNRQRTLVHADCQTGFAAALIGQQRFHEAELLSSCAYYSIDRLQNRKSAIQAYCYRNYGDIAMAHGEYQDATRYYKGAVHYYEESKPFLTNHVLQATEQYRNALQVTHQHGELLDVEKTLEALKKVGKNPTTDH